MLRNRVPIDGEPCGVLAIPIPEAGDARFVELIRRYFDELGASGGARILWRPIDDPRRTDAAYEELRTDEQKTSDKYSTKKFDSYVRNRGGADHHISRENSILAEQLGIAKSERPCVVFASSPPVGPKPVLHIPKTYLETREKQNLLGEFLVQSIGENIVTEVLENGYLTADSMERFSGRIGIIEEEILSIDEQCSGSVMATSSGSYGRLVGPTDVKYFDKITYDEITKSRKSFHLQIDVIQGRVFYKSGRKVKNVRLRNRVIRILAEIVEADRSVKPSSTPTGGTCASIRSAYNSFYEGRKIVEESVKGNPSLFCISRGVGPFDSHFEFQPPNDINWALILPRDYPKML